MLAHEILRRVQWIGVITVERSGKRRLRANAKLAEGTFRRTKAVVRPRRRDRVEASCLNVIKTIVAVGVRYSLTRLSAAQVHYRAGQRRAMSCSDCAGYDSVGRRGSAGAHSGAGACMANRQCIGASRAIASCSAIQHNDDNSLIQCQVK